MKKITLSLITILILNSCASILNGKRTSVKISSDKESKIVFEKDTIAINRKGVIIKPIRSKKTLTITVLKDNLEENFYLKKKLSSLFWYNIFNYGIGMFVDLKNDKRFAYNHNLHFATDTIAKKIVLSTKKIALIPKNKLFIYTSPLKLIDFFSIPMATLGAEYFIKNNLSISAEYGLKIKNFDIRNYNILYLKDKASAYRFETKLYNNFNLINNVHINEYLALEYREINSQYNANINYIEKNTPNQVNYITDDFATKKNVRIINLKYGFLIPIGEKFYFDFYSGFGLRIKKFNHINLEYDKSIHQIRQNDDIFIFDLRQFENYTKKSFLNYSLGFKFGIKF